MNWTCLIYGGPMLLATVYFAVDARRWFKGPRVNVELLHGFGRDDISPVDSGENVQGTAKEI